MSSKVRARTAGSSPQAKGRVLPALWLGAVVGASTFAASPASASQAYYDALNSTGTCQDCTLCHTSSPGSLQTLAMDPAAMPFWVEMRKANRLGQLPTETMDSDMDGFTDLEELREFGDPNDPMAGPGEGECPNQPEYGCLTIAHRAERRSLESAWAGLALLGALLLRRRTR